MTKQFIEAMAIPSFPKQNRGVLTHAVDLAKASQKFLLPENGRLYDDPEYRARDETEALHLPYPFIALEYTRRGELESGDRERCSKAILFARQRDDFIALMPINWIDSQGLWVPFPEAAIPRVGYLDRSHPLQGGRTAVRVQVQHPQFPVSDYMDEVGALLCLLNVLHCQNVHVERSQPKKSGRVKSALPFDSYHILTIDVPRTGTGASTGAHRSPREHLRRGHIRRLDDRRIWVNATVVGAGRGAGVVTKDYAIGAHA